jgi:hypothetical protein
VDLRGELVLVPGSDGDRARRLSVERDASDPARVSRDVAGEVGGAYLSARNAPHDDLVVAAYGHLQAETDRLFEAVVRSELPDSVRIVFTRCREPYECDWDLIEAVRASRVLEIPTSAIHTERIHPVLGCEYGGAFDRFRAVHDLIGHARTGFGFGLHDELAAWRLQDRLHSGLARWALATELLAINSALLCLGQTPEHKATLLEPGLLERSRARVWNPPWPSTPHATSQSLDAPPLTSQS